MPRSKRKGRNKNRMAKELQFEHVTRRFGEKTAVNDLCLSIGSGELFGLLGVNGAGKTTAIRMSCGLLRPTEGRILAGGRDAAGGSEEVRKMVNLSPQETAVAPNLTVCENLQLMAGLYGLDSAQARGNVERVISDFQLTEILPSRAKTLSGGWQRRLSIAMALVTEPEILFLDEPTLGLDVIARRQLWETIRSLKGRMTIVLTTHYLEEAEALCERIGIMADGRLRALGTAEELKEKAGQMDFEEAFIQLAGRGGADHEN